MVARAANRTAVSGDPDALVGLTADLSLLGVQQGDRVLDVGCGSGRHLAGVLAMGARGIGIDLPAPAQRRRSWEHVTGDGAFLPFADKTFDRVLCTEVLEHVADPTPVLQEIVRVLRPGGRIAVSVPTSFTEDVFWRFPGYAHTPGGHIRIFRTGELARLLRQHGLHIYAARYRNSLAAAIWLLQCLRGFQRRPGRNEGEAAPAPRGRLAGLGSRLYRSALLQGIERLGDNIWPKSLVLYASKPGELPRKETNFSKSSSSP